MREFEELPDILTAKEVANALRLGYCRTLELLKSGIIPSIRIGKNFRVSKEKLYAFANSQGSIELQ